VNRLAALAALFLFLPACKYLEGKLPENSPPLFDMEEPLAWHEAKDDEKEREALPAGSFTGIYAADSRRSLEEMEEEPEGLLVARVVENSPADRAGIQEDDLLVEVQTPEGVKALKWPSEWRDIELETKPGATLRVVYDRAGAEKEAEITVVERVHPGPRHETERFRDEDRVGVVVRTATEVESRAAGLGPGAGAVVVGLARSSPWRKGLRFGDLIVSVNGAEVAHPYVLLDAIRKTPKKETIEVAFVRGGDRQTVELPVSRRKKETKQVRIYGIYHYDRDGDYSSTWVLLGIYSHKRTKAAYQTRILWIFKWRGGDADRLEKIKEPSK
jgi:C-terminal processing protease CtpA/Prc